MATPMAAQTSSVRVLRLAAGGTDPGYAIGGRRGPSGVRHLAVSRWCDVRMPGYVETRMPQSSGVRTHRSDS
ncbi:hypothetical protein MIAR_00900 [Microbacterium arabinogalactanolyticum]|uniref:Uncharacterized protein n=1 Tax=Microbacterium arabinogalactanolyticum TaxID=69365 RepID=A0ABQ5ND85_9MICO|nr:hypothetical protein MIAR_00900 [Microbacterium arabinogalactanolyticum]